MILETQSDFCSVRLVSRDTPRIPGSYGSWNLEGEAV